MRFGELISGLGGCEAFGPQDVEVTGIELDSRAVKGAGPGKGPLFAALKGEHADGRGFIKDAVRQGAAAVLYEGPRAQGLCAAELLAKDARGALAMLSARYFGYPAEKLRLTGVTGTNGKTTTTYLLESIFREAGFSAGVIGTINYRYGGKTIDAPHTTPEAPELQGMLRDMLDSGVTHAAIEVSSHALAQKRVHGCSFDCAVFTNLTPEHLDFHGTMDEYFRCKTVLFKGLLKSTGSAVVNIDDGWGTRLKGDCPSAITYSLEKGADVFPSRYEFIEEGIRAEVDTPWGAVNVETRLTGEYNLQNILAAVAAAGTLGINPCAIGKGVKALARVPGRLEKIESAEMVGGAHPAGKRYRVYVDYAHTADALERALKAIRMTAKARVITVFGCGGNRDRAKRPSMGAVASIYSDAVIITSDNPRDEDPLDIIREIEAGVTLKRFSPVQGPEQGPEQGMTGRGYMAIPDRREAISKAVSIAGDGDTILVAGKGHENYQIAKGIKTRFDDTEEVKAAMAGPHCVWAPREGRAAEGSA
ncbi:MAG: UDP-N-acetylmuramoyl-L-alanyl-D-glutamate--2,6-diaminopimelate ligase [Deltaproteobacteria bacterium]|nr:UDP-N-acetylmuramoyl-L-alanyl-D-glutamate--2,6-diaminopimelate ligase [Deltaproteobacteria bacterium]